MTEIAIGKTAIGETARITGKVVVGDGMEELTVTNIVNFPANDGVYFKQETAITEMTVT